MVKLPVLETTGHALTAPFRYVWPLFPFYLVLQLGMVGVMGAVSSVGASADGDVGLAVETANLPLAIAAGFVLFIAFIMLAVLTHRVIAGVEEPWQLGRPSVSYFLVSLCFSLPLLAIILLAGMVSGGAMLTGAPAAAPPPGVALSLALIGIYVAFFFIFVRLGLALPAAALEQPKPLLLGYRASSGNGWRLFGCFLLIVIAAMIVSMILTMLGAGLGIINWPPTDENVQGLANAFDLSDPDAFGILTVNVLTNYFTTVASTAFLTYSLRALWPNVEGGAAAVSAG